MDRKAARRILIRALEEELFPELRRYGFSGPEVDRVEIDDVDPVEEALLYHFRQSLPSTGDVVLTVNVKSFARPTFDIVSGYVPAQGVKLVCPDEMAPPDRVTADMLEEQALLQASPRKGYAPFRQPLWAFLIGSPAGIRAAVHRAVQLLPDLVNWLRTRSPSKHIWVICPPRIASASAPRQGRS
jgi:hypothetical protein